MRNNLKVFGRICAVIILGALPTTGCPAPGGKLLPLASERVRVVFHEDTEMTGEAAQDDVAIWASGIWSPGGTDVVLDVNNTSRESVMIDFSKVKLAKTAGAQAALVRVVEYVKQRHGDNGREEAIRLYEREQGQAESATIVTLAPGSRRRLQAGFNYGSGDSPGGKLGERATLEVPVQRAPEGRPTLFNFAFEYKGR